MYTLDAETNSNISLTTDIDNLRAQYKTENGLFIFPSFEVWAVEKNLFYLLQRSKQIPMTPKLKYRPDYVSYQEYGTVALWPLILFVNGAYSIEEFVMPTILVPDFAAILEVARDRFLPKPVSDLRSFPL
jgi:hypothetical protein